MRALTTNVWRTQALLVEKALAAPAALLELLKQSEQTELQNCVEISHANAPSLAAAKKRVTNVQTSIAQCVRSIRQLKDQIRGIDDTKRSIRIRLREIEDLIEQDKKLAAEKVAESAAALAEINELEQSFCSDIRLKSAEATNVFAGYLKQIEGHRRWALQLNARPQKDLTYKTFTSEADLIRAVKSYIARWAEQVAQYEESLTYAKTADGYQFIGLTSLFFSILGFVLLFNFGSTGFLFGTFIFLVTVLLGFISAFSFYHFFCNKPLYERDAESTLAKLNLESQIWEKLLKLHAAHLDEVLAKDIAITIKDFQELRLAIDDQPAYEVHARLAAYTNQQIKLHLDLVDSEKTLAQLNIDLSSTEHQHARLILVLSQEESEVKSIEQTIAKLISDAEMQGRANRDQIKETARQKILALSMQLEELRENESIWPLGDVRSLEKIFDGYIRVGNATVGIPLLGGRIAFEIDTAIPLDRMTPLLVRFDDRTRPAVISVIENICIRLCAELRSAEANFTIFDPQNLGNSATALTNVARLQPEILHGKMLSHGEDLRERLDLLLHHVSNVVQTKLGDEFATIEHYNATSIGNPVPYEFIVIYDYPTEIEPRTLEQLKRLIHIGPRCGVFCIFSSQLADATLQKHLDVFGTAFRVELIKDQVTMSDWQPRLFEIQLDGAVPKDYSRGIVRKFVDRWAQSREAAEPPPQMSFDRLWTGDSAQELTVSIGKTDTHHEHSLTLNSEQSAHVVIAGSTGHGKSVLLHNIICGLCSRYPPDQLELYLVDFKQVEFQVYADSRLPHAKVVATNATAEFGLSVLEDVLTELSSRQRLFQTAKVTKLSDYRQKTRKILARRVLIIDEFQTLFVSTRDADKANKAFEKIAREGRAFGLHLILVTQTLKGIINMNLSFLGQMPIRIAFRMPEPDFLQIMGTFNNRQLVLDLASLRKKGEAIFYDAANVLEGKRFRSFYRDMSAVQDVVSKLVQTATTKNQNTLTPRIFDGINEPSIRSTLAFTEIVREGVTRDDIYRLVVGDSIRLRPGSTIDIARRSGNNILLVGEEESKAASVLLAVVLSIGVQKLGSDPPSDASCVVCDFLRSKTTSFPALEKTLPPKRGISFMRPSQQSFEELVRRMSNDVQQRKEQALFDSPRIFVVIAGLHQAQFSCGGALRHELREVLRDGPALGVHVILWAGSSDYLLREPGLVDKKDVFQHRLFLGTDTLTLAEWGLNRPPASAEHCINFSARTESAERFQTFIEPTTNDINAFWQTAMRT